MRKSVCVWNLRCCLSLNTNWFDNLGPSMKDIHKNNPFFDPPCQRVSEITEHSPPPGRPRTSKDSIFLQFQ